MKAPSKARRNAVLGLAVISALVLSGLAWATWSAVRLERFEAEEEARHEYEAKIHVVNAHLDSFIDNLLAAERNRPLEHYKAYYYLPPIIDADSRLEVEGDYLVPSPLLSFDRPDWMLLHFQVSTPQAWGSPELSDVEDWAMPAGSIPAVDRARRATAANWFVSLREQYDEWKLQEEWAVAERQMLDPHGDDRPPAEQGVLDAGSRGDRSAAEFARRGQRLILQMQQGAVEQCTPYSVMMKNLLIDDSEQADAESGQACVPVSATKMQPVWLELVPEGEPQLALIRQIHVESYAFCSLQGVLIDWPRFRSMLERELARVLPGAAIQAVLARTADAGPDVLRLRSIPARLVAPPVPPLDFRLSSGLLDGLLVVWGISLLALVAIGWGAMKYVGILERRMQFAAAVSHELRTPLTSFQLYSDLLAEPTLDEKSRGGYVETLRREARRLGKLVENVLLYSRLGDARPILHPAPVVPADVLERVAAQTAETCRAAGKELIVENRCVNGTTLTTDGEFVQQILTNLVENACKYGGSAEDRRIFLGAASNGTRIRFDVEDAGPGVDPSHRRAVFRPFRRGQSARDGATGGMGLGLALSRHWAECLGGQLSLARGSRSGGRYSRFVLELPRDGH